MKYISLGDICDVVSGGTPSRSRNEFWSGGTIPWIKIGNIKSKHVTEADEFITQLGLDGSSTKMLSKGTILYTIFATLGEVGILDMEACTNQAIAGITIRDSKAMMTDYLYYYLLSKKKYVNDIGRGVAQNNINLSILRGFQVPIITITEQQHIVEVMDKVGRLIAERKQELQKLDELIKARFVEMFGTYPANEKGWDTGIIRELVTEVRYGSSRKAAEGNSGKYPYLRMNNITYNGELDLTDTKTIDIPDEELDKCAVRRGDLLFNRTNSKELVGKTCVYNRDEMMVLAGFVVRVRLNDRALPEFVSAFMNTGFSKQMLLGMCKAAIGQANINAQELQNIGIYIPPIQIQKDFASFKAQVDKSKVGKYSNMSTQTKEKSLLFSRDGVFCKIWRHTEFRTFFSCFYSFPEPRVTMGAERQGIYDSCHPRAAG